MKVTTKGRYGLKAMIDIASATSLGKSINLRTIAEKQGISDSYLEQLIASLKKADLVLSTRGARGGYRLSRAPSEITVGDVLRVLEGSLSPVDCIESGNAVCGGGDCESCNTKSVWGKMFSSVNDVVDSISLKDLSEEAP
jgi:Rrf2 family protein